MPQQDLNKYGQFVDSVTSQTSQETDKLIERLQELKQHDINAARLLTAYTGLAGESGEFVDLCKKLYLHGKPLTEEVETQLRKELGDIIFYWLQGCMALNLDPNDVIQANIDKLSARYPGGFSTEKSENRSPEDK